MFSEVILLLGIIFSIGYVLGRVTHSFYLTGVFGYILAGILLGPSGINLVNGLGLSGEALRALWDLTVPIVLGFIALIIGLELSKDFLEKLGKPVVAITVSAAFLSLLLVFGGFYLYTHNFALALLLGSLAMATAPAGAVAVIQENRSKGPLTSSILAIVGIDDALCVVVFMFALAGAKASLGGTVSLLRLTLIPLREVLGGLALGALIGAGFSFVAKMMVERKLKQRKSVLILGIASVLLSVGFADLWGLSSILACMAIGAVLINLIRSEGEYLRKTIETITPPLYVLFFTLAGMKLRLDLLSTVGLMLIIFIASRSIGKIMGAYFPLKFLDAPSSLRYTGIAMLSQTGVAVGLAAYAMPELAGVPGGSEVATLSFTVVLATSVVFAIIGPIGARIALDRADEIGRA